MTAAAFAGDTAQPPSGTAMLISALSTGLLMCTVTAYVTPLEWQLGKWGPSWSNAEKNMGALQYPAQGTTQ